MQIIKKYANRKLYHTNRKQYITLEGIARLVQHGETIQVLDNETGEDITASILAQIVFQARGQQGGLLPTTVLTGLIQVGGDTLANLRRALFLSLGGDDLIETEMSRRLDQLVDEGTIDPDEATRLRRLLLRKDLRKSRGAALTPNEADVPTRNDVVRLHDQVDKLAEMVDHLFKERDGPRENRSGES